MNKKEKIDTILEKLGPHNISKNGAIALATLENVEGVIGLLMEEQLSGNGIERPECLAYDLQHVSLATFEYRKGMVAYLRPWIELPNTLPSKAYEALADHCESKIQ